MAKIKNNGHIFYPMFLALASYYTDLHEIEEHPENGSPVYPCSHMHIGTCLTTLQVA